MLTLSYLLLSMFFQINTRVYYLENESLYAVVKNIKIEWYLLRVIVTNE